MMANLYTELNIQYAINGLIIYKMRNMQSRFVPTVRYES